MEILKEISKDKLIIMVTHNPDLASKYSTRVVKILDGLITDDSNPFNKKDEKEQLQSKTGRTSMKFLTALHLSLNNLMTKKGRTLLTSFAGSIGIIGIALILSLSNGVQNYITKVQEDTLSSYPIMIQESTIDIASMMESMMGISDDEDTEYDKNKIYSKSTKNKKGCRNMISEEDYISFLKKVVACINQGDYYSVKELSQLELDKLQNKNKKKKKEETNLTTLEQIRKAYEDLSDDDKEKTRGASKGFLRKK